MNTNLTLKLITKNVIRRGTVFEAYHLSHGLSCMKNSEVLGRFIINAVKKLPDQTICIEAYSEEAELKRFAPEDIITLDGMDLPRLVKTYDLSVDGNDVVPGKRRGRKPKNLVEQNV